MSKEILSNKEVNLLITEIKKRMNCVVQNYGDGSTEALKSLSQGVLALQELREILTKNFGEEYEGSSVEISSETPARNPVTK